jgi:Sulfotransferase family
MLLSHVCKFIYLKTRKTAGTSVEIYFEPYCVDPKNYSGERHGRSAEVSEWGIVGSRRIQADSPWYNHMAAEEIRKLAGREVWDAYYKFCVIRNPFDKVVSYFWHEAGSELGEKFRDADFTVVRESFAAWTKRKCFPADRFIYTIADVPAVDCFLRYEHLHGGMRQLCARLKIPWQPSRLGRYKSEYRKRAEPFEEYYTPEAAARVEEAFAWELDYFEYPRVAC